jgi:hypothetical protein
MRATRLPDHDTFVALSSHHAYVNQVINPQSPFGSPEDNSVSTIPRSTLKTLSSPGTPLKAEHATRSGRHH